MKKSARTIKDFSKRRQEKVGITSVIGLNGDYLPEPVSAFEKASGEVTIENKNNAIIVLGRDRPGNILSGYGGAGHTGCGSIQMIVGRPSELGFSGPDTQGNAATFYISQKTDIDNNFGLANGELVSKAKSAIALKADCTRMIARLGIQLVTGTDEFYSDGEKITYSGGIDLNAGNKTGSYKPLGHNKEVNHLQPIPLGDNLGSYLETLAKRVDKLSHIVEELVGTQETFNTLLGAHTHPVATPVGPGLASPSIELSSNRPAIKFLFNQSVIAPLKTNRKNISIDKRNYLASSGPLYVNSRSNRTT